MISVPHFCIDFCVHSAYTILLTIVGLAQAHPNKLRKNEGTLEAIQTIH